MSFVRSTRFRVKGRDRSLAPDVRFKSSEAGAAVVVVGAERYLDRQRLRRAAAECVTSGRDQRALDGREKILVVTWLGEISRGSGAQGRGTKRGIIVGGEHNYASGR